MYSWLHINNIWRYYLLKNELLNWGKIMGWKICVQKNSLNLTFYSTRQMPDYFCYIVKTLLEAFLNMSLRCSCCSDEAFCGKSKTCGLEPLFFKCQIIRCRIKGLVLYWYTRCDRNVPRLILLLGCGYTSGHPCLQGGVLELPLSLGQGMVPAHLSVLCELRPCYCSCCAGCWKSKSSVCASSFVWNGRNGAETFEMLITACSARCSSHALIFWMAQKI